MLKEILNEVKVKTNLKTKDTVKKLQELDYELVQKMGNKYLLQKKGVEPYTDIVVVGDKTIDFSKPTPEILKHFKED